MKYFIGIVPSTETAAAIDQLRLQFCAKLVHHLEPHITVVPPFEAFEKQQWMVEMNQAVHSFPDFSLQLGEPFFFGKRVLSFYVQDVSDVLTALVSSLKDTQEISDRDTRPYHAHLTLAMQSFGTSFEQMLEMKDKAKELLLVLPPLYVEELIVFAREKSGWARKSTLSLSK